MAERKATLGVITAAVREKEQRISGKGPRGYAQPCTIGCDLKDGGFTAGLGG